MTALSIIIPEALAHDSARVAKKMNMSRAQFIRLAIENEINHYHVQTEQIAMAAGFKALEHHPEYLNEINTLEGLNAMLPDEVEGAWWKK